MAEQIAQAIDDGETKAEAAMGVAPREPIEFAKNVSPLVLWNSGTGIPHLDAHGFAAPATADDHAADGRVADGIGDQVEQDTLQEDRIAAHPRAARHQPERQFPFARRRREGALDSLEHLGNGKLYNLGAEDAGVEPRNIEQRIEEFVHRRY